MNCKELLICLSQAVGVSGREDSVTALAARELDALGEVSRSPLGDLICTIQKPQEGQKSFMLDAHVDEIGMIVTYITDEGFLKVSPVGGTYCPRRSAGSGLLHSAPSAKRRG